MSTEWKSLINDFPEAVKEALALPKEKQKFLWYTDKLNLPSWKNVAYTEEPFTYMEAIYKLNMGANGLYVKRTTKNGFTIKGRSLKFWYGGSMEKMTHMELLLKDIGQEWVINEGF